RRRHLDARAERGLPWCERQVEIEILAIGAEDGMRRDLDVEVEVAVAPTVNALATLARHAQLGAVGHALRDAHLEMMRDAPQESVLVHLGRGEVEIDLGAVVSLLERDADTGLEVLAGHRDRALIATRATAAAAQPGKEVGQVDVVESAALPESAGAEPGAPVGRRPKLLAFRMTAELVIRGALLRVLERLV